MVKSPSLLRPRRACPRRPRSLRRRPLSRHPNRRSSRTRAWSPTSRSLALAERAESAPDADAPSDAEPIAGVPAEAARDQVAQEPAPIRTPAPPQAAPPAEPSLGEQPAEVPVTDPVEATDRIEAPPIDAAMLEPEACEDGTAVLTLLGTGHHGRRRARRVRGAARREPPARRGDGPPGRVVRTRRPLRGLHGPQGHARDHHRGRPCGGPPPRGRGGAGARRGRRGPREGLWPRSLHARPCSSRAAGSRPR